MHIVRIITGLGLASVITAASLTQVSNYVSRNFLGVSPATSSNGRQKLPLWRGGEGT